jgi:lysophospholipase L1-like esterase
VLFVTACAAPQVKPVAAAPPPPPFDYSVYQKYSDNVVDPNIPDGTCKAEWSYIRTAYGHPELMDLGDSLYNGVQSLRINWWLSEWSAPTLVAIRMGLVGEFRADRTGARSFYDPQYPGQYNPQYPGEGTPASELVKYTYGMNLEDLPLNNPITAIPDFLQIPKQQYTLLMQLHDYTPHNNRPVVDNLAFSGAESSDLLDFTAGDYNRIADQSLRNLQHANIFDGFQDLSDAFFAVNAAFVLNPTHNPCLDQMTPVDQVALRVPQYLLVNIGANDGLWMIAYYADSAGAPACDPKDNNLSASGVRQCQGSSIADALLVHYTQNMQRLITRLAGIKGMREVFINNLAYPSSVANLVPDGTTGFWYTDLFGGTKAKRRLTDAQLRDADRLIKTVNDTIEQQVAAVDSAQPPGYPVFKVVDQAAVLETYNFKNRAANPGFGHGARFVIDGDDYGLKGRVQALDNRPLRFSGPDGVQTGAPMFQKIKQGGLASFDNMHLSSVGYELMANAVLDSMGNILPPASPDTCVSKDDPYYSKMKPGDCIAYMVQPGWSFVDETRRNFMLDRLGGLKATKDREMFSALADFAQNLP